MSMPRMKDVSGQVFGNLTVLSQIAKGQNGRSWFTCRCSCGKIKDIPGWRLVNGYTLSCGCARTTSSYHGGRPKMPPGESAARNTIHYYRRNARLRGIVFELSSQECRALFSENCHYCGIAPSNSTVRRGCPGVFVFNGIDRVDSSLGYITSNTVPCCKNCNYAKHDLSKEQFFDMVNRIYRHSIARS